LKIEGAEEELRILYVALTRARDRLVLMGGVRQQHLERKMAFWQSGIHLKGIRDSDTPLDWLMYNLYTEKPVEIPDKRLRVTTRDFSEYEGLLIRRNYDTKEAFEGYLADEVLIEGKGIELPGQLPDKPRAIQAKVAVTALAHENLSHDEGVPLSRPEDFLAGRGEKSPQETGIEIHRLMEYIDEKNVRTLESFMDQVKNLQKRKILSEDLDKAFDLGRVYGFFKGPLGRRLIEAEEIFREVPFVLRDESLGGALVQGVIDLYFVEGQEVVLIDFKSDYVTEGNYNRYLEAYTRQLAYYQRAIETLTAKKVRESYVHFFRINRSIRVFPPSS